MNFPPRVVSQLLFGNLFLPLSIYDAGADSIVSPCLAHEMGSILNLLLKWDTIWGGERTEQDRNILPRSWGRCFFFLSRKAGPLGARLREQCPLGTSLGRVIHVPCLHRGKPKRTIQEVLSGGQTPNAASQPARQLLSGEGLAACGLDLVPRYILFGPQSLEKCVSSLPMFKT